MTSLLAQAGRFRELQRKWDHLPKGRATDLERAERMFAQMEMFYLAQAICSQHAPLVQQNLNELRRQVMDQITNGPIGFAGQVVPTRIHKPHHWTDFQITPEFALDPMLTGRFVDRSTTRQLNQALREQIKIVLDFVKQLKEES